jgi:hypothetical protein
LPRRRKPERYGMMRKSYLQTNYPIQYNIMLLKEQQFSHLRDAEEIAANSRRKN